MNTEILIERLKEIYGDKYDYSKVEYVNSSTKVCLFCKEKDKYGIVHGYFYAKVYDLLNQIRSCNKCKNYSKITLEEFKIKANIIHNNKYDYSKSSFKSNSEYIEIICPIHGIFKQQVRHHLYGQGCPKCGKINKRKLNLTIEEFIEKARKVHGDKYDYSKVNYINSQTKICIICPIHGEFWQTPYSHLYGRGCKKCSKKVYDTKTFIEKAKEIHGDKYDYSKVEYVDSKTKDCIICPIHGEFWQAPNNHLSKKNCPKCSFESRILKRSLKTEEFIEKARQVHGDKYDYSKVEYINTKTKICIICPIHGEFWQIPNKHLGGRGCKLCNETTLEREIRIELDKYNVKYIYQANKENLKWLGKQTLDFYLIDYNIGIECQGEQHYRQVDFGFTNKDEIEKNFIKIKKLDNIKKNKCINNKLKLIYYTKKELKVDDEFINANDIIKLLQTIK